MSSTSKSLTYATSGVSIDAGNALVEKIKPLAKATARAGMLGGVGGFGALFDVKALNYKDPILVSTTDGVGTKLKLAEMLHKHDTIGTDLVAMCVNDLVVQGAEPLFFLDYFACGKLDVGVAEAVIRGIAEGCKQAGCALVGGETAEMPGMYAEGTYDLAGFSVGMVERDSILPRNTIAEGDVVLGLASSGVHSNGFSLLRHVLDHAKLDLSAPAPFANGMTLGEAFLIPTRIYVKSCLKVAGHVKAFAHITGGGLLENIPRILPENFGVQLQTALPPMFQWLKETGNIELSEMHRVFNCGIGMVAIVSAQAKDHVVATLTESGENVSILGSVTARGHEAVSIG